MPAPNDQSLADYRRLRDTLPGGELSWLAGLRDAAAQRFAESGWPTPRDEAWKYTNVAPVVRKGFAPRAAADGAAAPDITRWIFPDADAIRLVFVDGHLVPGLSDEGPAGIVVASLRQRLRDAPAELEQWLAADASGAADGFAALNTAFMSDGAVIHVPAGMRLERPVHLLFIAREAQAPCAAFLRNLLVLGDGASATVVQHHAGFDDANALVNARTDCVLGSGAVLDHCMLNEQGDGVYHFAAVRARLANDSRYVSHNLNVGARLARSDIHVELAGEGSECTLNGFYFGSGRQHIDNYTRIEHQVPRCASNELYKGVLDGRARGIFNGHVIVRQDAQKSDARQMNRNLLLSDGAEADTRPQLEIYADDVKCSHGATVGQLDAAALFYLRARGIDEHIARRLLIGAFCGEIAEKVAPAPVRARFEHLVAERLSE